MRRILTYIIISICSYMLWIFAFGETTRGQHEAEWIHCSGEAAVQNVTYEEAQVLAKRRARLDAIEKVCGISLQAETLVKDFMMAGDFIHSIAYGHVIEEKDIAWKTETLPPESPEKPPIILLRVNMNAKVVPVQEKPDPYFKIDLKLNRMTYQSGDEVVLTVKASKDCYLTVFNLAANDSVYILFPNDVQVDNSIRANRLVEIPEKKYRDAGLHIRVANLPGHNKDTEIVKIIATKQKLDIRSDAASIGVFGSVGTPRIAVTKLARWLSEIPVSERAEAAVMYTVQSE